MSSESTPGEWLQVDFLRPKYLTAIVTQGRFDVDFGMQYATSFKISYGNSTDQMLIIRDENGQEKVITLKLVIQLRCKNQSNRRNI